MLGLRIILIALAVAATIAAPLARASAMNDVAGLWSTTDDEGVVRLGACENNADLLCGVLVSSRVPERLRHGHVGMTFLRDLAWDGTAFRGTLISPEDGGAYRGVIRPGGDTLRFQGCLGPFCETQIWRRVG